MDLFNPVPTSGQIRHLRKMVRSAIPAAATQECSTAGAADPRDDKWPPAARRAQWLPVEPRFDHLTHALAAVGLAGLDRIEAASDDAHDAVEETLARGIRMDAAAPVGSPVHHGEGQVG